jgi:tetratricopeptide (TPR) repeat protein
MYAYDAKDLKHRFGIEASAVRSLTRAGHIHPVRQKGRMHYSFQDLIVLRTATALRAAKIPGQRISRTLRRIRESLPEGMPLSGLSIIVLGDRIAIREGQQLWESDSGQYALALEVTGEAGAIQMIDRRAAVPASGGSAEELFARGLELEGSDPHGSRQAYEACLAVEVHHTEARINLGRLLHLTGEVAEAERIYRGATIADALLSFNLAVLLEDQGRQAEAMLAYREALALDPGMADAHFNLARLHEHAGNTKDCFRHLLAYRRLASQKPPGI